MLKTTIEDVNCGGAIWFPRRGPGKPSADPAIAFARKIQLPAGEGQGARDSWWPVHSSKQPADADRNNGGRVGLRFDGST